MEGQDPKDLMCQLTRTREAKLEVHGLFYPMFVVSTHAHTRSQTQIPYSPFLRGSVKSRAHAKLNDIGTSCIADYIKHDNYNVRI